MKLRKSFLIFQLALFPLYSLFMVSLSTGFALFGAISKNKFKSFKIDYKLLLIFSLPLIVNIISLAWDNDYQGSINMFTKSLSFIIFYLVFIVFRPFNTVLEIFDFIKLYIISSAIFSVIIILYLLINIELDYREALDTIPLINEHPIYVNLITGLALIFISFNYFSRHIRILLLIPLTVLFFIANSRGVIAALLISLLIRLIYYVKNPFKVSLYFSLLLAIFATILFLTPLKKRYLEFSETFKYVLPVNDSFNSMNIRIAIYSCSLDLFKEKPLLGYGIGGIQNALNDCYGQFNTNAFNNKNFNTHNQYLNYLLSYGIIGCLAILFYFFFFFKLSAIVKDEYFSFLIFFFVTFLTENILSRNTGVVLFSMFNSIFYLKSTLNDSN